LSNVRIEGGQVHVHLNFAEKIGSLHGDLRFPRAAIRAVHIVEKPFNAIEGIRAPGTGVPGMIALGTWRAKGKRDFVIVYRGQRGIVVDVNGEVPGYQRIILSSTEPEKLRDLMIVAE
jgi:hypothetical protein